MFALLLGIAAGISLLGVALAPRARRGARAGLRRRAPRAHDRRRAHRVPDGRRARALGLGARHSEQPSPLLPAVFRAGALERLDDRGARRPRRARARPERLAVAARLGRARRAACCSSPCSCRGCFELDREIRLNGGRGSAAFREAVRNAGPAILGRGVVQLSTYVDMMLASLLAVGALARLQYAQTLYVLPISLFGMSVAAAALPELARQRGARPARCASRRSRRRGASRSTSCRAGRLRAARRIFVAGLYESGHFGARGREIVWLMLAAYSLGLFASASTRVYQSAFFALRDTQARRRASRRCAWPSRPSRAPCSWCSSSQCGSARLAIPAGRVRRRWRSRACRSAPSGSRSARRSPPGSEWAPAARRSRGAASARRRAASAPAEDPRRVGGGLPPRGLAVAAVLRGAAPVPGGPWRRGGLRRRPHRARPRARARGGRRARWPRSSAVSRRRRAPDVAGLVSFRRRPA